MSRSAERVQGFIGKALIAGVFLAGLIVAFGGILFLLRHGGTEVHYHVFRGEPTDLRTVGRVLSATLQLSSRGIIQLGLMVLVAAQLLRVALTVWLFAAQKDRRFVGFTLFVLAVMLFSLFGEG